MTHELVPLFASEEDSADEIAEKRVGYQQPVQREDFVGRFLLTAVLVLLAVGVFVGGFLMIISTGGTTKTSGQPVFPVGEPAVCTDKQFSCLNGLECIKSSYVCDGIDNCSDMSDEKMCPTCASYRYSCGGDSGQCIRREWQCDREVDCINGADELGCDVCNTTADQFTCRNYKCVAAALQCNGINDCGDDSDEEGCFKSSSASGGAVSAAISTSWWPVCYNRTTAEAAAMDLCALLGKSSLKATVAAVNAELPVPAALLLLMADGATNAVNRPSVRLGESCPGNAQLAITCQDCGRSTQSLSRRKRILGGSSVPSSTKWPWYTKIVIGGRELCGGTLISDRHVLTAAHCVVNYTGQPSRVVITMGSVVMSGAGGFTVTSRHIHLHPGYNDTAVVHHHDLALVEIEAVNFSSSVRPACLPRPWENDAFGKPATCYAIGLGRILRSPTKVVYPTYLQEVKVKVWTRADCWIFYKDNRLAIDPDMLCAGSDTGAVDTCLGDSGGPLLCLRRGSWILVGVTSWGFECGLPTPSIYSDVVDALPWLASLMGS